MPKTLALLPNRVSKVLTPEKKTRITELLNLIVAELGEMTAIPEADYRVLAKIGEKNIFLYDFLKVVMDKSPEFINVDLPIEEITKDRTYFGDIEWLKASVKRILFDALNHEQGIVGAEYRNATGIFEENVATRVARGDAKAILVQDEIDKAHKEYDRKVAAMQDAPPPVKKTLVEPVK